MNTLHAIKIGELMTGVPVIRGVHSFAFWTEMIFLPFMTILVTPKAICETRAEYAAAKKLLDGIILIVGVILIIHFFRAAISDYGTILNLTTVREITIPILYTLWTLPFCYLWWCYARWEKALFQLNQKTYHSDDLRSFAKRTFFRSLFLRPVLLKRAVRQFNLLPAKSRQDVREIIGQVKAYEMGRRNPETIEASCGWSPYAAEKFLLTKGYETEDFHDTGFDGEWFAQTQTFNLKGAGLFDTLIYRIKGIEGVVKSLHIKGSFKFAPVSESGLKQMTDLCLLLIRMATGSDTMPSEIVEGFENQQDAHIVVNRYNFTLNIARYEEANILDVEFTCMPIGE